MSAPSERSLLARRVLARVPFSWRSLLLLLAVAFGATLVARNWTWLTRFKTLAGHSAPITTAFFSSDGARIVTASKDRSIRLWDTGSGACIRSLDGHADGVMYAAFSMDGKRVASSSQDGTVRVWDVESGTELLRFGATYTAAESKAAVFSNDGNYLFTTSGIRDAGTGERCEFYHSYPDFYQNATFIPERQMHLFVTDRNQAQIWGPWRPRSLGQAFRRVEISLTLVLLLGLVASVGWDWRSRVRHARCTP